MIPGRAAVRRMRSCQACSARLTFAVRAAMPMPRLGAPRTSPARRSSHRPDLSVLAAAAEEAIFSVRLQPRDVHARGQVQRLQHGTRRWIHAPQLALVVLPRAVPQLALDPGDAGDEP